MHDHREPCNQQQKGGCQATMFASVPKSIQTWSALPEQEAPAQCGRATDAPRTQLGEEEGQRHCPLQHFEQQQKRGIPWWTLQEVTSWGALRASEALGIEGSLCTGSSAPRNAPQIGQRFSMRRSGLVSLGALLCWRGGVSTKLALLGVIHHAHRG